MTTLLAGPAALLLRDIGGLVVEIAGLTRERGFVREDGAVLVLVPLGLTAMARERMICAVLMHLLIDRCDEGVLAGLLRDVLRERAWFATHGDGDGWGS